MKHDRAILADRIRTALNTQPSTREVRMFGGLSFMIDNRMVVAANKDGNLLVRIDPKRSEELLLRPGAKIAEMGAGRSMGSGWLDVAGDTLNDDRLSFWIDVALEYNAKAGGR